MKSTMEIRFIRSDCPSPDSGEGYMVWTNQYTERFKCLGFVSRRNISSMKEYFLGEGYDVRILKDKHD